MAFKGPYPTVFSGHTTGMVISATTFSGGVTNIGTISPHGISVLGATLLSGGIVDTGIISGGIRIDSHGKIVGSGGPAIDVHDTTTFSGGISNAGALAGGNNAGILVSAVTGFAGGISNQGIALGAYTTLAYSDHRTVPSLGVTEGRHAAALALLGNYMAGSLATTAGGQGGTVVSTTCQGGQQPLLAHPPHG